ncbi:hypothetical protein [Methanobacterium aggregans]|uniref:hypothetical protein n=1 Tax=Methanobacterium aggregans TaxID=1615586 RepID=UPI001AE0F0E2|nr:hypothetical protein [Methanobacterium aggregans]MBP2046809.1 hypothetical protein [Methanobacterium aggregans]
MKTHIALLLLAMILVSMVGAGAGYASLRNSRNRSSDIAVDDQDLIQEFQLSKSPLVNFLPLGIHIPKAGQIMQIFILGSLLGLSWVMARRGDMEF